MEYKTNGFIPSHPDPRDFHVTYGAYDYAALPEEWEPDSPDFEIHNQGKINSCVGHAITAAYEIKNNPLMAYGYVYGNRKYSEHKGEGMITRDALKAAQKDGVPTLASYPFDAEVQDIIDLFNQHAAGVSEEASKHKIGNYYRLNTPEEAKRAMFEGKCVVLGLFLLDGMIDMESGKNPMIIAPKFSDGAIINTIGGHLVCGYGWSNRGIKISNSWSEQWGENGFGYVEDSVWNWSQEHNFPIPLVEAWAFELSGSPEPVKSGWYKQENMWRFSENGIDKIGWLMYNNNWYWMDENGWMATGWKFINKHWYYFRDWGGMVKGFVQIGKEIFYLNEKTADIGGKHIPEGACIMTDIRGNILEG